MKQQSKNNPKVSVLMVTYNHEKYIAQAIESVLIQKTNFDYELVIGEDCSTDGTREIVKEYAAKYPNKIRTLLHPNNLGSGVKGVKNGRLNLMATLKACRGEYVAFLEGDDYWTNNSKLQQQLDFLEKNSEYAGSFHDTEVVCSEEQSNTIEFWRNWKNRVDLSLKDVIHWTTPFHTSSFVVRRKCIENLPKQFLEFNSADIALYIVAASHGSLRRIPQLMSAYRRHDGGITQTKMQQGLTFYSGRVYLFSCLKKYCSGLEESEFDKTIVWFENILFYVLQDELQIKYEFISKVKIMLSNCGFSMTVRIIKHYILTNCKIFATLRVIHPTRRIVKNIIQ